MSNIIKSVKEKIGFIVAIVTASIIGGAATAVVLAAIPDTDGLIHGCYRNGTGALKVINTPGQTCNALETSLNWNQGVGGGVVAYVHLTNSGSAGDQVLDVPNSKNIASHFVSSIDPQVSCLIFSAGVPKPKNAGSASGHGAIIAGMTPHVPEVQTLCSPTTDAAIINGGSAEEALVTFFR